MKKFTNFTMLVLFCAAVGVNLSPLAQAADKTAGKRNFSQQSQSKSQGKSNQVSKKINPNATTTKLNQVKSNAQQGQTVVRDHRTPKSGGSTVIRDHRGQSQQQQVVPLTNKNIPAVVRDHRTATWDPIVHPKQPGVGKPKPNAEIRDHRTPKEGNAIPWKPSGNTNPPPLGNTMGSGPEIRDHRSPTWDTVIPPKGPTGGKPKSNPEIRDHRTPKDGNANPWKPTGNTNPPPLGNATGNGPEIRDHRTPKDGTTTPWQPISGNNPPPLGTGSNKPPVNGDPVVPPKRPLDGIKGPLGGVFDQGKPPVADPPANPPQGNPPQNPQPGHDKHDKHRGFPYWLLLVNQNRPLGNAYYCDPRNNFGYDQTVVVNETVQVQQPATYQPAGDAAASQVVPVNFTEVVDNELPQLTPGAEIMVMASNLGDAVGQAVVQIGEISLPVEVVRWEADAATVRVPMMLVSQPTPAQMLVLRADGSLARSASFKLTPPATQRL